MFGSSGVGGRIPAYRPCIAAFGLGRRSRRHSPAFRSTSDRGDCRLNGPHHPADTWGDMSDIGRPTLLLDSSGRLTLLDKADLREISIPKESPMPSYEGKLSAQN